MAKQRRKRKETKQGWEKVRINCGCGHKKGYYRLIQGKKQTICRKCKNLYEHIPP